MAFMPHAVLVTYGPHIFSGFANGDFVTVDQDGDTADVIVGAAGQSATIIRSADQPATAKITLIAESLDNRLLTQIYAAQRNPLTSAASIWPLTVSDPATGEKDVLHSAVILRIPSRARGEEVPTREWSFKGVHKAVPIA